MHFLQTFYLLMIKAKGMTIFDLVLRFNHTAIKF